MVDQRQCRLCLQYFKQGEDLMKIPLCEHIFHINCLKKWLMDFQKCPVCESNIICLPDKQNNSNAHPLGAGGNEGMSAISDPSPMNDQDKGIEFKKIEPESSV